MTIDGLISRLETIRANMDEPKTAIRSKSVHEGFQELHSHAHAAGVAALDTRIPTPMVVEQHVDMLDDSSPVEKQWYVPEGMCGFAWVSVRPGTSSFARWWMKNVPHVDKAYYGGVELWVTEGGQSVERKEAYARAYAEVLREAGIEAYAGSRLD